MKKTLILFSVITLLLFACMAAGCGEDLQSVGLPEHIRLDGNMIVETVDKPLYEYEAVLKDFSSCRPEDCHHGRIISTDHYQSEEGAWDDIDYYFYEDGYTLIVSGESLTMGTGDYERYSQLLTYLESAEIPAESLQTKPFPLQDAQERSKQILGKLHVGGLVPEQAVPLSSETIRDLTKEMKDRYAGMKLYCFDSFPEGIGAWYLSFRQEIGGIPVGISPQVSIVVTKSDIAYLDIGGLIEKISDGVPLETKAMAEDAVRRFADDHAAVHKEYGETITVNRIAPVYFMDPEGEKSVPITVRLFPAWHVESRRTMHFRTQVKEDSLSEVWRIPDGKKYR